MLKKIIFCQITSWSWLIVVVCFFFFSTTGLEYETGTLAFLMDATISASVLFHGFKTYPFTFSVNNYYIKVADAVEYDRSLCNCTQMMQGKRPPLPADLPAFAPLPDSSDRNDDQNLLVLPEMSDEGTALQ